jgi:hypothetical protein
VPVENFTYLDSLVSTNPVTSEGIVGGDDHIRGIKSVLKETFPGLVGAVTRAIDGSWGFLAGPGTAEAPSYAFAAEPTLGLYRPSAGLLAIVGRLIGNGAVPVGSLHQFLYEPTKLGKAGNVIAGMEYLELDGSTYQSADYPRLATHMGVTGSTFTLINAADTGRFLRSRRSGVAAGVKEAGLVGAHGHTATADAQGYHAHAFSGTTGGMNANNPHTHPIAEADRAAIASFNDTHIANGSGLYGRAPFSIGYTDINHGHPFSGSTDGAGQHSHNITVAANVGVENRPEALSVIMAIKT